MHSGIYFILNKINLKLYIGSAVYFARRRSEHFTRLAKNIHHNEHLQRAYNKYGKDAFEFIIIECVNTAKLFEREEYYIAKHKTTEEEFGYNKCEYGRGLSGKHHSQETKDKIRRANKGKTIPLERRIRIANSLIGVKHSAERIAKAKTKIIPLEVRAKMSAAHKIRHAANPALATKGSDGRWGDKEPLILNSPPIIVTKRT